MLGGRRQILILPELEGELAVRGGPRGRQESIEIASHPSRPGDQGRGETCGRVLAKKRTREKRKQHHDRPGRDGRPKQKEPLGSDLGEDGRRCMYLAALYAARGTVEPHISA